MPSLDARTNPYVGPKPFAAGQTLFGRDREVAALSYMLTSERIVLLYSPSGAGKSSLIQAGLLPRLARRFDVWGPARVNLTPPDGVRNRYVWSTIATLEDSDSASEMTLAEYAAQRTSERHPLVIFDQFEEVLRVDPVDIAAKRVFFEELGEMLHDAGIWALFVLREDYLAPLDPYRRLLPTQLQNRFRIDRLTREMAMEAIAKPVEGTSRKYSFGVVERLVDNLAKVKVQQLDGSFREELGVYVEPLQLQVVCYDLWERLAPSERTIGLDKIGEIGDALSNYYVNSVESACAGDERAERRVREWFQNELITADGVRNQVRHEGGKSAGLENAVIARLVDTYLVRAESHGGGTWYELSHDRLVEPIVRNNEEWFGAHLTLVERRALQWEQEGRPEGLLLKGKELAAARRWAEERGATERGATEQGAAEQGAAEPERTLTETEKLFLAACRKRQQRTYWLMSAVAAVILFLMVTTALGVLARRERDRAELNLQLAKQAVDESLSSAGRQQARESADPPEMEAFRRELLEKAATFYSVFTHEESSNVKLRAEAAWAHSRLGDVNRLLERDDDAVREYKLGIAAFEGLVRQYPGEVDYRRGLAYCHNWLGETIRGRIARSGEADGWRRPMAKAEYDAAIALLGPIHDAAPDNALYAQELARSYYNRGILSYEAGDLTATAADFGAAIRLLEPIGGATSAPGVAQLSPLPAQDLARVYNDLGTLVRRQGQHEQARGYYERAIQLAERFRAADPENREYKFELAQYYNNQAMALVDLQQLPAAVERNRQALELIDELASPAPALSMGQLRAVKLRGEILLAQGSPQAQAESDRELELLEELQRRQPASQDPAFQIMYARLAGNYIELATREVREGKTHEAQDALQSLGRILTQLTPEDRAVAERSYEELRREVGAK